MTDSLEEKVRAETHRREFPETETLLRAYEQYSEEARYRDRIMHNSYYLVLIGVILLAGNLLSVDVGGPVTQSFELGFTITVGALVAIGIAIIMSLYDRKCTNAEEQRAVLEAVLDERFTETGLFQDVDPERIQRKPRGRTRLDTMSKDNPFAIQQTVMWGTEKPMEETFIDKASIVTTVFAVCGVGLLLIGVGILVNSQVGLFTL